MSAELDVLRERVSRSLGSVPLERDLLDHAERLEAKLSANRCGRGHETLPLVLWDCPECHEITRRERDSLAAGARLLLEQYDASGDFTMGGRLTNQPFLMLRDALDKVRS